MHDRTLAWSYASFREGNGRLLEVEPDNDDYEIKPDPAIDPNALSLWCNRAFCVSVVRDVTYAESLKILSQKAKNFLNFAAQHLDDPPIREPL